MCLQHIYNTFFHFYERKDLSRWEHQPSSHPVIYGMYHIYCDTGWEKLVSLQMSHLKASGLFFRTKRFFVSCITVHPGDIEKLKMIIPDDRLQIISVSSDAHLYEYPALDYIKRKCDAGDCYFYYFHTKGISYHASRKSDYHFKKFKRNEEAWRNLMEYFLMDKWEVAVNVLNEGYDTYGSYRYPPQYPHQPGHFYMYAGNFWWVRSEYVRKLQVIRKDQRGDRFLAERWIYQQHPRDFSAFDTWALLYSTYLPSSVYRQSHSPLMDRCHFMISFNWQKFLRKVFGYQYGKHNNDKFQKV
ncbi:MAG: hypothetical protein LKF06_07655 [Prevotella sp.]|nr:hypothetical protein [Prevotella sp.]